MKKIAITGGIGSGKSTVKKQLSMLGYLTTDADALNRIALTDPQIIKTLTKQFGPSVVSPTGEIHRPNLSKMIFADPVKRRQLESIMHPAISAQFKNMATKVADLCPTAWFFYEASLIFEAGRQSDFDAVILVTCNDEVKKQRLKDSRGMTDNQINAVMASQMSDDDKHTKSTLVIDNSFDEMTLLENVFGLVNSLFRIFGAHE